MEKTEKNLFNLITDKKLEFSIIIDKPKKINFWQKYILKKKVETERFYKIKHLVLNDYYRIAQLLDECNDLLDISKDNFIVLKSISAIAKYQKQLTEILTILLNETPNFLLNNLTDVKALDIIFKYIEFNSFLPLFLTWVSLKNQITARNPIQTEK